MYESKTEPSLTARAYALVLLAWCSGGAWAADFVGIVHPHHHITLSVAVPGVVARVLVEPGKRIEAQQPVLWLDDKLQALEEKRRRTAWEDRSELLATQERLKIVQPLAEDARKLVATKGAISREDAARNELDYVATRGRLAQLQAQKEREKVELDMAEADRLSRRLAAPVGGVITKVAIDVGEWARPGDALIEMVDASVLHLRVNLPAALAKKLKTGAAMPVGFEPAMGLDTVQGTIDFISSAADAASGLMEVRVRFANPNGRIPPGIKGLVKLEAGAGK